MNIEILIKLVDSQAETIKSQDKVITQLIEENKKMEKVIACLQMEMEGEEK